MNKKIKKEIESGCEYLLPDYMGDIKKILSSRARCIPGGKLVSEGELEMMGAVEYEILYADSENRLTAIVASSDYAVIVPINTESYVDTYGECKVSNLSIRITGPRKVSLKANVEADLTVAERAKISVEGDGFDTGHEVHSVSKVINAESALFGKTLEREYAEEGERLEGTLPEDVDIISASGSVHVFETVPTRDGVEIKGELVIVAIVKTATQPPFVIKKTIPFDEVVSIDGADAEMPVSANAYVTSAVCGIAEDGEDCVITLNAIVEYEAVAFITEEISVITDAYLGDAEVDCKYHEMDYLSPGACQINECVINEKIPRAAIGCADVRDVLTSNAEVKSATVSQNGKMLEITGEIALSGVACEINVDGTVSYVPIKHSFPYSTNVNLSCQIPQNPRINCSVTCNMCEALLDAEDLHVKCTLAVRVRVESPSEILCLAECTVTEPFTRRPASVISVYYPTADDTLFGVAKRFHTTTERLALDNSLPDTAVAATDSELSLVGVKKLIIKH